MASHEYGRVEFPTTNWSLVERAGAGGEGLQRLLQLYLPAMRTYLGRTLHVKTQDVDDLLQSFLADKVVASGLVEHADRRRGRFRSFLLASMNHFVRNVWRRDAAQRRSPGGPVSDVTEVNPSAGDAVSPDGVFEAEWARGLLSEVLRRMGAECEAQGRQAVWGLFEARVLQPSLNGTPAPSYNELVGQWGFKSPGEAHNALVTAKRMFERHLRSVIGDYAADDAEIDEEIVDLRRILSKLGA